MSKYSALSQYLASLPNESVEFNFSQIESILEDKLPPSARTHPAWWSNDTVSHAWSQQWLAAGWKSEGLDLEGGKVSFRRTIFSKEAELAALQPRTKETIFDLLELVGISTDAWVATSNSENVKANPSFCYDWAFGSPHEGYALCVWHGTLAIDEGRIVFRENLRELSAGLRAEHRNPKNTTTKRNRSLKQSVRAQAFDDILNVAYARGMPVSVILCDGNRASREELGDGSSEVAVRSLDPVKWYVHSYNEKNGEALLVRGMKPPGVADGTDSEADDEDMETPDAVQQRAIRVRRGQADFRQRVLAAYKRVCTVTGCRIVDLLEAAHIQPHAEVPNYRVTNGLLLRADIHTLYDLNLLTIDPRYRVQLAPALKGSEYWDYRNMLITLPDGPSEVPNAAALTARYEAFKAQHGF